MTKEILVRQERRVHFTHAYIRHQHQIQNFVRFCETALKFNTVKKISLTTVYDIACSIARS